QPVAAMTDQHPMHGGGGQPEPGGDPCWTESLSVTHPQDALLEAGCGSPGPVGRDARPVDQASLAELLVAGPPTVSGGSGDAHLMGDVGDRPPGVGGDPPDQGQPS